MADNDDNTDELAKARSKKKKKEKVKVPPLFNIPPATKWLFFIMIAVYFVQEVSMFQDSKLQFFSTFGFVPTNLTDFTPGKAWSLLSPVTYMFIHGSLTHLFMNMTMLLAFGSGVEKWLGKKKFLIIFFGSGLVAILTHYIMHNFSPGIVIGASGATSGLFAAAIVMLRNMGTGIGSGPYGIYPLVALFIVVTIVFSFIGAGEADSIAWLAHLGGFAGGLIFMKLFKKL